MEILVTGGSGSVGSHLTGRLAEHGHGVRILDKSPPPPSSPGSPAFFQGGIEDPELVERAVSGSEAIVHLAWSFSDDPVEAFRADVGGHLNLLEAAARHGVRRFVFASSAIVYGAPMRRPIDETHPCDPDTARKPLYALAKLACEKLCRIYCRERMLPATVFRFWWGFGEEIGGKHLRAMIRTAMNGEAIKVPAGAGGSFLHYDDLSDGVEAMLTAEGAVDEIFNLCSFFMTWEEVAGVIVEVMGRGTVEAVAPAAWEGAGFLADAWGLSDAKARKILPYCPAWEASRSREALKEAMSRCAASLHG